MNHNNSKLAINKQKRYFDNNFYIYCREESYRVEVCLHYFSDNTRFQSSTLSRMKEVDLPFLFSFYFIFDLFSFILFLELGLGIEWQDHTVTHQSYHMTWSQVTWHIERHRRFWKNDIIQCVIHMDLKAYTWVIYG